VYLELETERLLLRPLQENDLDYMFQLDSDPVVIETMEGEVQSDLSIYRREFIEAVNSGEYLSIIKKDTNDFIGYIAIHQYVNKTKDKIKYSQMWTAILPEYWGQGYCTEATRKLLHFAFLGIKTPWICANQFHTNPAAGKVLIKCGLHFFRTLKMNHMPYDQYRYTKGDYFKEHGIVMKRSSVFYDYSFQMKKSPYSYENPIRYIDNIQYIKEPTGFLCGQSVVAMLANVTVNEVIQVMQTDKGTSLQNIKEALLYYGIKDSKSRIKYTLDTVLPDLCILSLQLPGYGHWSLYYKGMFYDPEFGVLNKCPERAKLCYYWEILN
jgi:RimJ/RimL family protein N-acetyltransferase